ncbi:MAG: hypothetical protein WC455_24450 [Dehalococcoidia bacterium]|jgi:post-segregation antitoxin (ccd killing protein)
MALAPKYIPMHITVREDLRDWIMEHSEINLSGLVQVAILKEIELRKKS